MQKNIVQINGQSLPVREYKGQRVVTIKDVAEVHGVKTEIIRRNFNRNRKHFIENVDYFVLKAKEIARVNLSRPKVTNLNVFTESGYLMLVKSLTDDLAWKVQRELVNGYFKVKEVIRRERISAPDRVTSIFPLLDEEYRKLLYYRLEKGLTQLETARILGIGREKVQKMEANLRIAGLKIPTIRNNHNKYQLRTYKGLIQLDFFEV